MQYDTIIIGSGAGGLAAAICLARVGQKVLVLEQHYVPGGWCHSFALHGSRFTPGVHYVGLMEDGASSSLLYKGLGVANDLRFFKMNPEGFEHCWVGEERFDIPADYDCFVHRLQSKFPKEKKQIKTYLDMVRTVSTQLQLIPKMDGSLWSKISIPWKTRYLGKYGLFSLKRVMDWYLKDPLLKRIVSIQCGDHGLPPAQASFPLHCAIMDHYFEGGYYPMGGGASIVKAMTKAFKLHGGELQVKQKVQSILLENNDTKAIGVQLQNGEKIYANTVISNADPSKTYLEMLGKDKLSDKLQAKLSKTKYSSTSLMLFITVDMDMKEAGLDSGNVWMMPNSDTDEVHDKMMETDILSEEFFSALFISCTTLKDPLSFDGKHHVLEVITYINYDAFSQFKDETSQRSDAYQTYKAALMDKMLRSLNKVIPGIKDHVVHKDLGTPLTNEFYINATLGSVYGTEKSLSHIGPNSFQHQSEIENLYLCGGSVLSHGVAGSAYSGVQAAAKILGCTQDDLIKPNESQKVQIFEAEDDSNYPSWLKDKIAKKQAIKPI